MASADELIREAQFALQNAGPGASDEHKNVARAKKYAMQVIRKYPRGLEAAQARNILAQLNVSIATTPPPLTRQPLLSPVKRSTPNRFAARTISDEEWQDILRRSIALPSGKKKKLAWFTLPLIIVLVPYSIFVIFAAAAVYGFNLPMLKRHALALLNSLESGQ